jgi:magnesium transporter
MPPPQDFAGRSPIPAISQEKLRFVYLSEMLGRPVCGLAGDRRLGRLVDVTASTEKVFPRVTGLLVKKRFHSELLYFPWNCLHWPLVNGKITVEQPAAAENGPVRPAESDILLKKSFLDRQLISTSGYKVVRVNDLHLIVEIVGAGNPTLWLVHIDIGFKGLLRRLGWAKMGNGIVRWLLDRDMKDVIIPWKYVQTATAENAYGSLQLSTDSSKLSEIHPADLADILEDLGAEERNRMIESLDPATAAATLAEMPLTLRVRIAESIEPTVLRDIVHEMQTDNVVDLLDNLSPEERTTLMATFSPEMIAEIKELSQLSPASVGSIMNTDFLAVKPSTTVREAMEMVRATVEEMELIYYLYVLEEGDRLCGVVTLRHLMAAEPDMLMVDLMHEHPVSVTTDTSIKRAARVFFKYDFDAIPVIDDEGQMRGIVSMRDTLERVFPEVREESKG